MTEQTKLCECGCGQPAPIASKTNTRQGYRKGKPRRFVVGHNGRIRTQPVFDRFWSKVQRHGPDECWEWIGRHDRCGYGSLTVQKRSIGAHRLAYAAMHGEISDGMHVLHSCDNPGCVNPAHLRLGTHQENMADRDRKRRHWAHAREVAK